MKRLKTHLQFVARLNNTFVSKIWELTHRMLSFTYGPFCLLFRVIISRTFEILQFNEKKIKTKNNLVAWLKLRMETTTIPSTHSPSSETITIKKIVFRHSQKHYNSFSPK